MSSLFCIVLAEIYLLYATMSIYCVGYAFTVIYLLLDARNLLSTCCSYLFFWF